MCCPLSSLLRPEDMMTRRSWLGALKWCSRLLRRDSEKEATMLDMRGPGRSWSLPVQGKNSRVTQRGPSPSQSVATTSTICYVSRAVLRPLTWSLARSCPSLSKLRSPVAASLCLSLCLFPVTNVSLCLFAGRLHALSCSAARHSGDDAIRTVRRGLACRTTSFCQILQRGGRGRVGGVGRLPATGLIPSSSRSAILPPCSPFARCQSSMA